MRRLILLSLFAVLIFAAAVPDAGRVRGLAPGVFFWQGDRHKRQPANCGWAVFKDYVFVIDANFPWGAREILPEIKKTTGQPIRFVFDTHYHADPADRVRVLGQLAQWDARTVVPGHGRLATTETIRAQQAYLDDMWKQVNAGVKGGKTAEQLGQEIDLSKHGSFGAGAKQNAASIRAMYRKVAP